jgi:hypothetical protein
MEGREMRHIALLVLVVTMFSCLGDARAQDASPVASPLAGVGDVGKPVRFGTWTLTLKRVDIVPSVVDYADDTIAARGKFIVVRLEVMNQSTTPDFFPVTSFRLIDGNGRQYDTDFDVTSGLLIKEEHVGVFSDKLQPSLPYAYPLVFDVAPDAQHCRLFMPGTGGTIIALGV